MSYVLAAPELMTAAATDLAAIGSAVDAAHAAAAAPTTGLIPAAADEVSTGIAALFSSSAADYQAIAGKASTPQGQFVTNLTTSAGAYAGAENALTVFLQALGEGYLALGNAVFTPLERLIENGSPLGDVALVALIGLLIPYTLSVILLNEIIKALTGQPI